MEYLLVVDVQPEFVKDRKGKVVYERLLDFISKAHLRFNVIAPAYINKDNPNMKRLVDWEEMESIVNLEFKYDSIIFHSGYSIDKWPRFESNDVVYVVGFDTDACVLSHCFDLFNKGVNFKIIADGCWSSGGRAMHDIGLDVMHRQFRKALDTRTKLEDLLRS